MRPVAPPRHGSCRALPPAARRRAATCHAAPPPPPPHPASSLFILGLGYTGSVVAQLARDSGWTVHGSTRRQDGGPSAAAVVHTLRSDGRLDAAGVEALVCASHVLVTVPPAEDGDRDAALSTVAAALNWPAAPAGTPATRPAWTALAYLSSTTVYPYGDAIDEATPVAPPTAAGAARVEAEKAWTTVATTLDIHAVLVRTGAIYGPRRSALDAVRRGDRGKRADGGAAATPRAHVRDVARIALAALAAGERAPRIVHAVDNDPAPRQAVLEEAGRLLGRAVAGGEPATSPGRRVSSAASRAALGVELEYGSFREGLRAIRDEEAEQ